MIAIIDYGAGNLFNISNAIKKMGYESCVTNDSEVILKSAGIILPGVGHARAAMENMKKKNIIEVIEKKVLIDKVPFLGICLGMQLLFKYSEEGNTKCLGWIDGKVSRIENVLKVPQIGWNNVEIDKQTDILKNITNKDDFYFIHSYCVKECEDKSVVAYTEYGDRFISVVQKDNIIGTQFHPEKSGEIGMKMIDNFCKMVASQDKRTIK